MGCADTPSKGFGAPPSVFSLVNKTEVDESMMSHWPLCPMKSNLFGAYGFVAANCSPTPGPAAVPATVLGHALSISVGGAESRVCGGIATRVRYQPKNQRKVVLGTYAYTYSC